MKWMDTWKTDLGESRDDKRDSLSRFWELCLFNINESWLFEWNETEANFLFLGLVSRLLLFVLLGEKDVEEHDFGDSSRLWLPYKVILRRSRGPKLVWNFFTNFGVDGNEDGDDAEAVEVEVARTAVWFSYIIIMVKGDFPL
jgi:hypothetical protein